MKLFLKDWSWWTDSNPRPADYKSAALPTVLHQQIHPLKRVVEATGLEPAASWSQTKHSTKLSYASILIRCRLVPDDDDYYNTSFRFCQHFLQSFLKKVLFADFWLYYGKNQPYSSGRKNNFSEIFLKNCFYFFGNSVKTLTYLPIMFTINPSDISSYIKEVLILFRGGKEL